MFTIRNAIRNILRSKGRSILIGIIITVIAFSVCIGLSIRESAVTSKDAALESMTITASISPNRDKMKPSQNSSSSGSRTQIESLSLSSLKKYAKADSVKSFYYTLTASLDASGNLEAYSTSSSSSSSSSSGSSSGSSSSGSQSSGQAGSGTPGGMQGGGMTQGDFTLTGYSSDEAMTDFTDGTCKITSGKMFAEGKSDMTCVISDELAEANSLSVGDTITLANPNDSSEKYKLTITGIYTNSQSSADAQGMPGGGMNMTDPANEIYCSYGTLNTITTKSAKANSSDSSSAVTGRLNGTYVVGSVKGYNSFKSEVKKLGLSSSYTVSSPDIESYERSAEPLENLAEFAGWFLLVILLVGAVILVVMNIFSTRERKYEIGVLTAIGMKKRNVAKLFVTEIVAITLVATAVGGGIGAAVSTPVTNALLSSQITSSQDRQSEMDDAFGRENNAGGSSSSSSGSADGSTSATENSSGSTASTVSSSSGTASGTTSAATATAASSSSSSGSSTQQQPGQQTLTVEHTVNGIVLLELLAACLALAGIASLVSVVAIMRYEPLQILSNRD